MKNGNAITLLLLNKLKNNLQFNQPLDMHHGIDVWISDARKPGQAKE